MRKKRKIWTGILAGLLVVIGLLIAVWDWNWFKPVLEAQLSSAAGQTIKINGDFKVHPGWVTTLAFDQVTVTNDHWQGPIAEKQVAAVNTVSVSIDIKQLLSGHLSFPSILVDQPNLTLRRVAVGEANWTPTGQDKPTKRSALPDIGKLEVKDGRINYQDSVKGLKLSGTISSVEGNGGDSGQKTGFTLSANGQVQKSPLVIKASGGPLLNLSDTSKPYPLNVDVTVDKTRLKLDGAITDPTNLSGLGATLELQGPSTGDLFGLLNVPAPETPPYHIKGHLIRKGETWTYENFTGTVGNSDLEGTLLVETGQPRLNVHGNLVSRKLDFEDIGPLVGIPRASSAETTEQKQAAAAYHADDRILPNATLSLGKVRSVDADVTFKATSVLAPNLPLDNVDLHVILNNGVLSLSPLDLGVAGGEINSTIRIDATQDKVQTDYDIRFHNFEMNRFMSKGGFPQGGNGKLGGRIKLRAPGNSVRESLGNSDGSVGLVMDKGQISDLVVAAIGIDIGEVLKVLMTKDKLIPVRCVATYFDVKDGLMTPQAFVIDTESTAITGSGTINLKDEKLNLQLSAAQKTPSLLAAPTPIDITGTFKHPEFGLDPAAAAERGGAALALGVLLTPIGSLLAFIDTGAGENANCAELVHDVRSDPKDLPAATQSDKK